MDKIDFIPKKGDIKVDSLDLLKVIQGYGVSLNIVFNNLDILDNEEREAIQSSYDIFSAFHDKYIKISHFRRLEHLWFLVLKKIDTKDFVLVDSASLNLDGNNDISFYFSTLNDMLIEQQELPKGIGMLIGLMVSLFGFEDVRREIWGSYLEIKAEREKIVRSINTDD